jgi:hypothetical protein
MMRRSILALLLIGCSASQADPPRSAEARSAVLAAAVQPHLRAFYARQLCAMMLPYSAALLNAPDPSAAAREACEHPAVWAPFERIYTDQLAADLRAAKLEAVEAWKRDCAHRAQEGPTK